MQRSTFSHKINNLIFISGLCLLLGVGCSADEKPAQSGTTQIATSPSTDTDPTKTQTTMPPEKLTPTPTQQPTDALLPPTEESIEDIETLVAPLGSEALIDGILDQKEWEDAMKIDLADQSEIFLMQAGGYIYLGIKAKPEPVTSICLDQGEQVLILHSSAAIGTAVYELRDATWQQVRDFEWCCRETADSPQAQDARQAHLQADGWIANNGRLGNPDEVEFKISQPGDSLRLAVNSIGAPDYRSILSWPDGLDDDCSSREMIAGPIPEQAQFVLNEWITVWIPTD